MAIDNSKPVVISLYNVSGTHYVTREATDDSDGQPVHDIFCVDGRDLSRVTTAGGALPNLPNQIRAMLNTLKPITSGDIGAQGAKAVLEGVYLNKVKGLTYRSAREIPLNDFHMRAAAKEGLLNAATDVENLVGPLKAERDAKFERTAQQVRQGEEVRDFTVRGAKNAAGIGVSYLALKTALTQPAQGQPKNTALRVAAGIFGGALALRYLQRLPELFGKVGAVAGQDTLAGIGRIHEMAWGFGESLLNFFNGQSQAPHVTQLSKSLSGSSRSA